MAFEDRQLESRYQRTEADKEQGALVYSIATITLFAVLTAGANFWIFANLKFTSPYGKISPSVDSQLIVGIVVSLVWLLFTGVSLVVTLSKRGVIMKGD